MHARVTSLDGSPADLVGGGHQRSASASGTYRRSRLTIGATSERRPNSAASILWDQLFGASCSTG